MRILKFFAVMGVAAVLCVGCTTSAVHPQGAGSSKPISVRLELDQTHVSAGRSINGMVVFNNKTNKSILVHNCPIDGWLEVGLVGKPFHFEPRYFAVGCGAGAGVHVPPGASRHRISVATTWQSCPSECKEPPPLPAGTYKTQVFIVSSQPVFSSAAPLTVHLRAAR